MPLGLILLSTFHEQRAGTRFARWRTCCSDSSRFSQIQIIEVAVNGITKQSLPFAVNDAVKSAGCSSADFPDLALRILMSGAIDVTSSSPPVPAGRNMELLLVNPASGAGIRVAKNAMNPFVLASALFSAAASVASAPVTSFVVLMVNIAAACSAKLTKDQAALILALKKLQDEQKIPSALAVAKQMVIFTGFPVSEEKALAVAEDLKNVGVPFTIGPGPHSVIQCREASVYFPHI